MQEHENEEAETQILLRFFQIFCSFNKKNLNRQRNHNVTEKGNSDSR